MILSCMIPYAWCMLHAGTCTACMCMACAWRVQAVMRGEWAWAGIPGMRFEMQGGSAVLVTPWGHGTWGVVPSRKDVLYAEFAQKKHMLRFLPGERKFVSTRCDDGEVVHGAGMP